MDQLLTFMERFIKRSFPTKKHDVGNPRDSLNNSCECSNSACIPLSRSCAFWHSSQLTTADAKTPPTNLEGRWIGVGACDLAPPGNPHKKSIKFHILTENNYPLRPTLKNKIALAFLNSRRLLVHITHIECSSSSSTSRSKIQYICSLPLSK